MCPAIFCPCFIQSLNGRRVNLEFFSRCFHHSIAQFSKRDGVTFYDGLHKIINNILFKEVEIINLQMALPHLNTAVGKQICSISVNHNNLSLCDIPISCQYLYQSVIIFYFNLFGLDGNLQRDGTKLVFIQTHTFVTLPPP